MVSNNEIWEIKQPLSINAREAAHLHTFTCNKEGAKVMAKQRTAWRTVQARLFKIITQLLLLL